MSRSRAAEGRTTAPMHRRARGLRQKTAAPSQAASIALAATIMVLVFFAPIGVVSLFRPTLADGAIEVVVQERPSVHIHENTPVSEAIKISPEVKYKLEIAGMTEMGVLVAQSTASLRRAGFTEAEVKEIVTGLEKLGLSLSRKATPVPQGITM